MNFCPGDLRPDDAAAVHALKATALHELSSEPGFLGIVQLDQQDAASVQRCVTSVSEQVDAVHLLINNAAMPNNHDPQDHVLNTAPDAMTELFDVNCTGVLRVTHAFLPLLRAGRGVVANLSSTLGSVSKADSISPGYFTAYRCSKAAMNMLTRTLAAGEPQVTFVLLQPGAVATDMGRAARSTIPGMPPDVVAGIPVDQSVRGMLRVLERDVARAPQTRVSASRDNRHVLALAPAPAVVAPDESALNRADQRKRAVANFRDLGLDRVIASLSTAISLAS